jgi:hypothetical protein
LISNIKFDLLTAGGSGADAKMVKWVIEGSLERPPRSDNPPFVSEPFLTEEGTRSFAILLNEKGYAITARIVTGGSEPARSARPIE